MFFGLGFGVPMQQPAASGEGGADALVWTDPDLNPWTAPGDGEWTKPE